MTNLTNASHWIEQNFAKLAAKHQVPAAAIAISSGSEIVDAATGVLSLATGVEANTDSVFQIGSITKLWTATLVMQLVDDGLLDLDRPFRDYVPAFRLGDESAAAVITTRQLLSHTAGFEGDIFTDTGNNDDAIEKFVAELAEVPQLFAPGEQFSYNNAGYCVLGRLVEVLREKPYAQCLREHLFEPLGLKHTANGPEEAILFRAAVGHVRPEPNADFVPAPIWSMARSNAPAGSQLAMRARDLLAFARMQLASGVADDGTVVLSPESAAAMRERQVELPELGLMGDAWGLGWEIFDTSGGELIGHDGSTIGQGAFMRIVPGSDVVIVLLTNGGDLVALYLELFEHLLRELADVRLPLLPTPPAERADIDASRYLGTYSSEIVDLNVTQDADGRVWLEQVLKGAFAEVEVKPETTELTRFSGDTLIAVTPAQGMYQPYAFTGDDGNGRSLYLHVGRALRRADAPV